MTVTDVVTRARRLARATSSAASDSVVKDYILSAIRDLSNDVGGFDMEAYLNVSEFFNTRTNMALNITVSGGSNDISATDVAITSTNRNGVNGTIVASDLQTAIGAAGATDVTVAWTDYYFTLTDSGGATITIDDLSDDVTYIDAQEMLGINGSGTTITGDFPEDCTVIAVIPDDFLTVQQVEFDDIILSKAPQAYLMSPESSGNPYWYSIRDYKMYLMPTPDTQKLFRLWYRGSPKWTLNGYQELGLTNKQPWMDTGLTASTQYYFKTTIDNGTISELNITTAANDTSYASLVALMNTAIAADDDDCEVSLVNGDLRVTSKTDATGVTQSSVFLSAGTTGTDLFATLTDFSAFESAVPGSDALPFQIQDEFHEAIVYRVSAYLLEETFEEELSLRRYAQYNRIKNKLKIARSNSLPTQSATPSWYPYRAEM